MTKIMYVQNPYGDFATLRKFLTIANDERADAAIVGGDFLPKATGNRNDDKMMSDLIEGQHETIDRLVLGIQSETYQKDFYERLKFVLGEFSDFPIWTFPGNRDSKRYFEALSDYDVHDTDFRVGKMKIYTYGSAPAKLKGMEAKDWIGYGGPGRNSRKWSFQLADKEWADVRDLPARHFRGEGSYPAEKIRRLSPDIVFLHNPPYGRGDLVQDMGTNIGSLPILEAIESSKPSLVVSGHVREDIEISQNGNRTVFANIGSLAMHGTYGVIEEGRFSVRRVYDD